MTGSSRKSFLTARSGTPRGERLCALPQAKSSVNLSLKHRSSANVTDDRLPLLAVAFPGPLARKLGRDDKRAVSTGWRPVALQEVAGGREASATAPRCARPPGGADEGREGRSPIPFNKINMF